MVMIVHTGPDDEKRKAEIEFLFQEKEILRNENAALRDKLKLAEDALEISAKYIPLAASVDRRRVAEALKIIQGEGGQEK